MNTAYMVTGCGVSFLCQNPESIMEWVSLIIEKGGIPIIRPFSGENKDTQIQKI